MASIKPDVTKNIWSAQTGKLCYKLFSLFFLHFWGSNSLSAQPIIDPSGSGNSLVVGLVIIITIFLVIWGLLQRLGDYLSNKTFKPFWENFWKKYFATIGLIIFIVLFFVFIVFNQ